MKKNQLVVGYDDRKNYPLGVFIGLYEKQEDNYHCILTPTIRKRFDFIKSLEKWQYDLREFQK